MSVQNKKVFETDCSFSPTNNSRNLCPRQHHVFKLRLKEVSGPICNCFSDTHPEKQREKKWKWMQRRDACRPLLRLLTGHLQEMSGSVSDPFSWLQSKFLNCDFSPYGTSNICVWHRRARIHAALFFHSNRERFWMWSYTAKKINKKS